ncbi:MAG: MscS Mechanosensitive ion channel [Thermoleophilia bacterium]|nr:MscS Mechanosensitive ion channel [Thermoleophilia bacterium]MCZ4497189.1 MscS Mechanosensitive ion channel [Thermoleophilia bacterium]
MNDFADSLTREDGAWRWLAVALVLLTTAVIARWVDRRVSETVIRRASLRTHALEGELVRAKRMRTAATLVASMGRYAVVVLGVIVAVTIATAGTFDSALTSTVIVIMVAFVLQRVLVDMIAGALLLFEGHIAVGDFVKTTQMDGLNGVVERVGLRSTTLRGFNGDQHIVLNGGLSGFTRVHHGWCDFELELFVVTDPDATEAVEHVCERLQRFEQNFFLRGPELVQNRPVEGRAVTHLRIRAIVPPTLEWLCERTLPAQLEAELGDLLVGGVQVFNLDERSFAQYRAAVVLPERLDAARPRVTRRLEEELGPRTPSIMLRPMGRGSRANKA